MSAKAAGKKMGKGLRAALSVVLAAALVVSGFAISDSGILLPGPRDAADGDLLAGMDEAVGSTLEQELADVPRTEEERRQVLDGYLADGTVTEDDLQDDFIVESLTGSYLLDSAERLRDEGFACGTCLESGEDAGDGGPQEEPVLQQVQDEFQPESYPAGDGGQDAAPADAEAAGQDLAPADGEGAAAPASESTIGDEPVPLASSYGKGLMGSPEAQAAPGYSTDAVLKDIRSVTLYDHYGQAQTRDFFFSDVKNCPDDYVAYVQTVGMPPFYSPVLSAEVRDRCAYVTLQLPVGAGEQPNTFEALFSKDLDWDGYVKVVSGQPAANDSTMMANIASTPGYDASREQAYRNAYKLAPFASYEDIVESGNAIPASSGLYSKTIQELWPVHAEKGMKVSMLEGEEEGIVRNVVYFSDGTSETSDLEFLGTASLTASYTMGEAGILYQPGFWTLGESARHGIDRMAAFIRSKTYNDYFAPFKSDVKMHRTVRDYFDRNIHDKAEEVAANLLTNIPSWNPACSDSEMWNYLMTTAENAKPTDNMSSQAVELKMFNLLFLYTYWDRFLNFGIGGSEEMGFQNNANAFLIIAFRGGVVKPGLSLVNMTYSVRSDAMLSFSKVRLLSGTVINTKLAPFTGIYDAPTLIRTLVRRTTDYADVANWFADYMSTIAFYHEYKPPVAEGHPETGELIWRGWDQASRRYPDYLPIWLTMEPGAMYMGSTSMLLACGSTYIYTSPADFEFNDAYRASFKARLDAIFPHCAKYASTVATIVGKERVNTSIVLTLDNMTSRYDTGTAQNVYYESHGLWGKHYTEDPWQKHFYDVSELYDTTGGQGAAAATYNMSPTNKRILFLAYTSLSCGWSYYWSHEMAHALDNDVFLGAGRRDGGSNEDFTDGLLTQGHGSMSPVINLCYDYDISSDIMSNYTRDRIYGKDAADDFYGKVYETLDVLDYAALQAFLRLDRDEQNAVASQVWFSGQNGTSPLDSGTNTAILCSRSKVLNGYDGTTATMPVNASAFNDGSKKFETIEEVYDNQLFLRGGIPDGGSITWQRQIYVSEDNRGSWWFPVHANTFYPDSRSFKVMMYRMMGREGYDAFATYGSAGGNDLQKLKQITGCSSYKEWQMKTWDGIEAKKRSLAYVDFSDLVDKFEAALKSDAEARDRNLGSMSSLRTRMFYMMKRVTDDFRYGIYENPKPAIHIRTLDDLLKVADNPQGNYVLDSDIDASSVRFEAGGALLGGVFYGKFDGQGHKIYVEGSPIGGLFEGARHAYVKNLTLEGIASDTVALTAVNCELENIAYVKFERQVWSVDDFVGINDDLKLGVNKFHLMADLDLSEWSAANTAAEAKKLSVVTQFMGGTQADPKVFNGNGHTITGLSGASLFDRACYAEVRDFTLKSSSNLQDAAAGDNVALVARRSAKSVFEDLYLDTVSAQGRYRVGFIVGDDGGINALGGDGRIGGSRFNRIQVTNGRLWNGNSSVQGNCCYAGFIAGRVVNSDLSDIFVQGALASYGVSCGGVVGAITCSARLERCISKVSMSATVANGKNGILVGDIESSNSNVYDAENTRISACFGLGAPANDNVGRLAKMTASAEDAFVNCYEDASITVGASLVGDAVPGVKYARTDLGLLRHLSKEQQGISYTFPMLWNGTAVYENLGFDADVWEFDPTIEIGYPMLRFVGNRASFGQYDLDIAIDYKNEKLVCSGSDFNTSKPVSLHNLPFRSLRDYPGSGIYKGDWQNGDFASSPVPFASISEDPNSVDLSEIIEYEGFENAETESKGTRSISLYFASKWSGKSYNFIKTVELSSRPAMDCADRLKGVRANSKGLGAIHYSSFGAYGSPELEYRLASSASDDSTGDWTPITAAMTSVAPGSYEVRIAATDHSFASYPATVSVDEFDPSAVIFPLVLELGGGSWAEGYAAPEEYNSEEALVLPDASQVKRNGYTFAGWYADPAHSGSPITSIPAGRTEPVAVYARWVPNTYNVRLNLEGGALQDPAGNVASYVAGTEVVLPVPVHPYRTFAGWYGNAACEGNPVASITPADFGDKEYWAKWEAVIYNVVLHPQEGELAEGFSDAFAYEAGVGALLPGAGGITRLGHTFKGWYDNRECTGQPIAAISKDDAGDKELWAKWAPDVYDVTLAFNGGKLMVGEQDVASYQYGIGVELPDMERNGYRFDGWYDNPAFAGSSVESIAAGAMGTKSFWAKWTPLTYAISYDLGSDESGARPPAIDLAAFEGYATGSGFVLPDASVMVWDGHVFAGWYREADFSGSPLTRIGTESYGDLTLHARWVGNACVLSFDADGGSFASAPDTIYGLGDGGYDAGDTVPLPAASQMSRRGYSFEGWYGDASFSGAPMESVTLCQGVVNLYAKWTLDSYSIDYELAGGSFVSGFYPPAGYTVRSGGVILPVAADLVREGYDFKGWYGNAACTGSATAAFDTLDAEFELGDRTFYAKWEPVVTELPDNPDSMPILSLAIGSGAAQAVQWDDEGHGRIEVPRDKMPAKAEDFTINVPDGIYVHSIVKREDPLPLLFRSFMQLLSGGAPKSDIWDIILKHRADPNLEKHYVLEVVPVDSADIDPGGTDEPTTPGGITDPGKPSVPGGSGGSGSSGSSSGSGSSGGSGGSGNPGGSGGVGASGGAGKPDPSEPPRADSGQAPIDSLGGSPQGSDAAEGAPRSGNTAQTGDGMIVPVVLLSSAAALALLVGFLAYRRLRGRAGDK